MKRLIAFTISLWMTAGIASAQEWKEEKGDHFIVYYVSEAARPKEVIRKAELYYNRIANELGYARYSNFWQWDKRVKIYIHPTQEAFQKATGMPAWSHGMASYLDKSIHSIEGNENFLDSVLPHETAHLVFRDFVGLRSHVPLWMDEGVAQWMEDSRRREALATMPELAAQGDAFTLATMMATDIRNETKDAKKVYLFYLQAVSLVDFLVTSFGPASFTDFCRELRDGKPFETALRAAYPDSMATVEQMEARWWSYLKQKRETLSPKSAANVLTS